MVKIEVVTDILVSWLRSVLLGATAFTSLAVAATEYPAVKPGVMLQFPRDHGSHPAYRTEWWYLTGQVRAGGRELGIQVTFFRNRPSLASGGKSAKSAKSAFSPRQLLFAHAALADARHGRLRHDQRSAREGFGLAYAREGNTDVAIDDWNLVLAAAAGTTGETYRTRILGRDFGFDLAFRADAQILLQGEQGYSRKGPQAGQASYYYSRPQLAVSGVVDVDGERLKVEGIAWLDHEWSSEIMPADARGWDWAGVNLDDGGAFMAFQMRRESGAPLWRAATQRSSNGSTAPIAPEQIRFTALRRWRSARSGAEYPVSMEINLGERVFELVPLMDDQELDSRASVGTIYWEGAVIVREGGRIVGRGYLELTGYWRKLRL